MDANSPASAVAPQGDIHNTFRILNNVWAMLGQIELKGQDNIVAGAEAVKFISDLLKQTESMLPKPEAKPEEAPSEAASE